ncbi:MAG: MFS transporter, partial [Gammaproteobacteria bacterium]
GNVGAVAAGFLMKGTGDIQQTLSILSGLVLASAVCAIVVRLSVDAQGAAAPAATNNAIA